MRALKTAFDWILDFRDDTSDIDRVRGYTIAVGSVLMAIGSACVSLYLIYLYGLIPDRLMGLFVFVLWLLNAFSVRLFRSVMVGSLVFVATLLGLSFLVSMTSGGLQSYGLMTFMCVPVCSALFFSRVWILVPPGIGLFLIAVIAVVSDRSAYETNDYVSLLVEAVVLVIIALLSFGFHTVVHSQSQRLIDVNESLEKSKRAAEAANETKSAFLANMSHELRTPMNGVLGMAAVALNEEQSPKQRERLQVITKSGETLMRILNDILDLTKVEAGTIEIEEREFDLEDMIEAVEAAYALRAQDKGLALKVEVADAARGWFLGDPVRIRQILDNLLSNGLKFTDEGGLTLTVDAEPDPNGPHVILRATVRDTGVGIPEDVQAKLFRPFTQADESAVRRHGGTGLGLSVAKELCTLMGGDISMQSKPGEGATFTFTVRVQRVAGKAKPADVEPAGATYAVPALSVLVAEDNAVNQMVLRAQLDKYPLRLVFAANGQEAVEQWRNGAFDLIFMDIQMPIMSGVDAALAIRGAEKEAGATPIPIIALTANAMTHQVEAYIEAGMDDVVVKPVRLPLLLAALQRLEEDGRFGDVDRNEGAAG